MAGAQQAGMEVISDVGHFCVKSHAINALTYQGGV